MRDTKELQRTFYSEMVSRLSSKISTPPERWGPWLYYQFIPEGKEYPVFCRKLAGEKKGWLNTLISSSEGGLGGSMFWLTGMRLQKSMFIIGDGNNMYDFTYVENVAHAHVCAERALASEESVSEKAAGQVHFL